LLCFTDTLLYNYTVQTIQHTVNTDSHITKTPTQMSKHPTNTQTDTLQNMLKQPQHWIHNQ